MSLYDLNIYAMKQACVRVGKSGAKVIVAMGSESDMPIMQHAMNILAKFEVRYEKRILSAHRTPDRMFSVAAGAASRGIQVIIAGAGGAAHLPGMIKSKTRLPVIGVPIPLAHLDGLDSTLSIQQMPKGKPVNTMAIGKSGAINAGLAAVEMLAISDLDLARAMDDARADLSADIPEEPTFLI